MINIWVDFNRVNDEQRTSTLRKFSDNPDIAPGDRVMAYDFEGNKYAATVVGVDENIVTLELDS